MIYGYIETSCRALWEVIHFIVMYEKTLKKGEKRNKTMQFIAESANQARDFNRLLYIHYIIEMLKARKEMI